MLSFCSLYSASLRMLSSNSCFILSSTVFLGDIPPTDVFNLSELLRKVLANAIAAPVRDSERESFRLRLGGFEETQEYLEDLIGTEE